MSAPADAGVIGRPEVLAIAVDVFATMVDGTPGTVGEWSGVFPGFTDPLVAWVDLHGAWSGQVAVETSTSTAHELTRALLGMADDEPVGEADLVDAFGEVANVVGGNVKSLLPVAGTLGLPRVAVRPPDEGPLVHALHLGWGGRPLVVTVRGQGSRPAHR
ncbi:chemotaxis protein CheX [Cellulomonas sp. P22]|uniref:chemotaxis protein CheX n=1 Tax=Cellulomonas sp. P22 TaxID=3373189 RepID=UPI00378AE307